MWKSSKEKDKIRRINNFRSISLLTGKNITLESNLYEDTLETSFISIAVISDVTKIISLRKNFNP